MKALLLTLALLLAALQHGSEPPAGWLCGNNAKTADDKKCKCHRTCEWNPETRQVERKEDKGCTVYCWPTHCACLNECDSEHHH